jgi:hypothetical protein
MVVLQFKRVVRNMKLGKDKTNVSMCNKYILLTMPSCPMESVECAKRHPPNIQCTWHDQLDLEAGAIVYCWTYLQFQCFTSTICRTSKNCNFATSKQISRKFPASIEFQFLEARITNRDSNSPEIELNRKKTGGSPSVPGERG